LIPLLLFSLFLYQYILVASSLQATYFLQKIKEYQQFSSQSNSPNIPHGVQMDGSGVQLNDQELVTP